MPPSPTRRSLLALGPLLALPALPRPALAQAAAWPDRAVRVVVPIPPGGAPDIVARVMAQRWQERLGQPFPVENRSGGNGGLAAELVARARPDGHTLLVGQDSLLTVNPFLYENLAVNPLTDLLPVAALVANQFVLAIHPSVPARTFAEFLDHVRGRREAFPYASGGVGSQHQLAMEMLARRAGLNLLHVPFRGGQPASNATVQGDTLAMFAGTSSAPLIQQGRLRAIAVTGPERSPLFPDLPRIGEVFPGYEVQIWLGLFAPPATPEPVLARVRAEVAAAQDDPEVKRRLDAAGGMEPLRLAPAEFRELIRSDAEKYRALIRELQIKVE